MSTEWWAALAGPFDTKEEAGRFAMLACLPSEVVVEVDSETKEEVLP